MKSILFISHSYPTDKCPWITPFIKSFCENIAENSSIDVHVLVPEANGLSGNRVQIHSFPLSAKSRIPHKRIGSKHEEISFWEQLSFLYSAVRVALRLVKEFKIELIHAHWAIPSGVVAWVVSQITKVPFIVTVHGRDVLSCPKCGYTVPNRRIFRFVLKLVLNASRFVVTASPSTYRASVAISKTARVETIPMGADLSLISRNRGNGEALLFLGDLVPVKGVRVFIDALSMSTRLRGWPVYIVGDGEEREELQEICIARGLTNVAFLGYLGRNDLPEIFGKARALVFPSFIEAFGLVVLEALAAGLQVVGSDVGILSVLKEDPCFQSRIFVAPSGDVAVLKEQIEKCVDSPVDINTRRVYDLLRERYSWSVVANAYINLYQRART